MKHDRKRGNGFRKSILASAGIASLIAITPVVASTLPVTLETLLESSGRANILVVLQQGDLNQLSAVQFGDSGLQSTQHGDENNALVLQAGNHNSVLLDQQGNRNNANIEQYGEGSSIQLFQYGEANFSIQQLASSENITVTQY